MTVLNRRTLIKIGGAAAALPLLGGAAFAQVDKVKAAFVLIGTPDDNGWNFGHDTGRKFMLDKLGADKVETTVVTNVAEGPDSERVFRELAQQGHHIIFATSFGYGDYVHKVAKQFPDVKFEWATGNATGPNVSIYNAKFHEGRAVVGTIAGLMTKTNTIAYIGSFPIPEVRMGINAYAIAARKVNPAVKVKVVYVDSWFDPAKEADAARALIDQGVDVITQHTDGPAALQVAEERGIVGGFGQGADMSAFAPKSHLTSIIDVWGPHYVEAVQAVLDGTWKEGASWPGIAAGEVVIGPYNEKIPAEVVAKAEEVKNAIAAGTLHPFAGPINDNAGAERVAAGDVIDDGEFWAVDWYAEGVEA
ncbi:MAG TPA: BMP family ABC transporter substrate-binding protein [Devosia sp.]|jgi:simple sugar transport system substrate-binding protein|uniref:BMP family ABC transporter substrate-binding protein n=1 Tax=Devosia sp. TaxID=1871048 RepID=UPI002DDD8519|nr:BMP family ABC transporter substrate-binding protein [Devosia sp.]HEV2514748.1 BMP family ABC transporter substrate-binding protein [Devosia sp.]